MTEGLPLPNVDASQQVSNHAVNKIVDSRIFITTARLFMIVASSIGLPVAAYLLIRVINTADDIVTKVDQGAVNYQLMDHAMKNGFKQTKEDLRRIERQYMDHEGRIRYIERLPVLAVPTAPSMPIPGLPSRPN